MKAAKDLAAKLLAVQLFRLTESDGYNKMGLRPENFKLQTSKVLRSGNRLLYFSGVFVNTNDLATLPFIIAFSHTARGLRVLPAQFTASGIRSVVSSMLALLAVVDFLETTGELSHDDGLTEQMAYVTRGGDHQGRAHTCAEYASFRERSIKALPYDDSLLMLGEAA